jgi:hypothetical protein
MMVSDSTEPGRYGRNPMERCLACEADAVGARGEQRRGFTFSGPIS